MKTGQMDGMNDMQGGTSGPDLAAAAGATPKDAPMDGDSSSAAATADREDCVPLSALGMPDDSEQMTSPEVGDQVQYTVEGKISRIEGDKAYVDREAINGQPVEGEPDEDDRKAQNPAEPPGGEAPDEYGQLEAMAGKTAMQ